MRLRAWMFYGFFVLFICVLVFLPRTRSVPVGAAGTSSPEEKFWSLVRGGIEALPPGQRARIRALDERAQNDSVARDERIRYWTDSVALPIAPLLQNYYEGDRASARGDFRRTMAAGLFFYGFLYVSSDALFAPVARRFFARALAFRPQADSARVGMALCDLFGGAAEPMRSVSVIKSAYQHDSTDGFFAKSYAEALGKVGRHRRAADIVARVVKLYPEDQRAWVLLAENAQACGDTILSAKAMAELRQFIPNGPKTQKSVRTADQNN